MTNTCPTHKKQALKYYHGMLGYEAVYCPKCGYYEDSMGNKGHDQFFMKLR